MSAASLGNPNVMVGRIEVTNLQCSECKAILVHKFSKFQHGMAFLHRDIISKHGVPHWIPDFENRGYLPGFDFSVPNTSQSRPLFQTMVVDGTKNSCVAPSERRSSLVLASFYPGLSNNVGAKKSKLIALHSMSPDQQLVDIHSRAKTLIKLDPKSIFASER